MFAVKFDLGLLRGLVEGLRSGLVESARGFAYFVAVKEL